MWIMLTTKLSTNPSPPKMSLFWSEPWPNSEYARRQKEEAKKQSNPSDVRIAEIGIEVEAETYEDNFFSEDRFFGRFGM